MKEFLICTLFAIFILIIIVFSIGLIVAIISLAEPWVGFLFERYDEWAEEIQSGIKLRRMKKKLIKEKLKELIGEEE